MTEALKTLWDKASGVLLGLVPMVVLALILTWYDVQNLKKLQPLKQDVTRIQEQINALKEQANQNREMNHRQWRAISRKADK